MAIAPGYVALAGSERPRPAWHSVIGPADPEAPIGVTIVVRPRPGSPPLPDIAHWQATPPGKRQFPSADEYARTYGAAKADLDALAAFAAGHGLTVVGRHAGRRHVTVHGTVAQMNAAFGVTLNRYQAPLPTASRTTGAGAAPAATQTHFGYDGRLWVPSELIGIVHGVVGLDDRQSGIAAGASGNPPGATPLSVPDVAQIYNFPTTAAGDQTIGVLAQQTAPEVGANYQQPDITNYFEQLNIAYPAYNQAPTVVPISLSVSGQTFANFSGPRGSASANELTQDICTAATIAQGATVNVYFTQNTEQGWLVFLNRVLQPEGENQPTVLTCSMYFGLVDTLLAIGDPTATNTISNLMSTALQALATRGINFFYAQGDWGADNAYYVGGSQWPPGNDYVQYPGSDPWAISCGGTMLGELNPSPPPQYLEWVWSDAWAPTNPLPYNWGATGGGVSQVFPPQPYQTAAGLDGATDSNFQQHIGRGVPDIAGMVNYSFAVGGTSVYPYPYEGTSCVAPLYAGLYAVVCSALGVQLGFLNTILYQLGAAQHANPTMANPVFNDIQTGNNDSVDTPQNLSTVPALAGVPLSSFPQDAPYFKAGKGWDACTGWGSINGLNLLNAIAAQMYTRTFYFQMGKNTYGWDEVINNSSYPDTFYLVLEGFTPNQLGSTKPSFATGAGHGGDFNNLSGVTLSIGSAIHEQAALHNTPQRILFPCGVNFGAMPDPGLFPLPPATGPNVYPLTATISIQGQSLPLAATAAFELVGGADPYFSNTDQQAGNVFYLSQDLRVFTVTPGIYAAPIAGPASLGTPPTLQDHDHTQLDTGGAYQYIQDLLNYLDDNYSEADAFSLLPDQSSALIGDSSVTPTTVDPANPPGNNLPGKPFINYTFAVARVRLSGFPGAGTGSNVSVFFRLFATETSDTDFQPTWTYPSNPPTGNPAEPLLGTGSPPVTIPFFATGNYDGSSAVDYHVQNDYPTTGTSVNSKPINVGLQPSISTYFGCYLNIYSPDNTINIGGKATPVSALLPGTHHCVVAQIAYAGAPIVNTNGTTWSPENSDKLAQRNLQITASDNPGPASAHRVPQTFDVRPSGALSTAAGALLDYPDELMIDWGDTPVGSVASIYWPQVKAPDVLALATRIYSTHQLSAADANTVRCTVPDGFTCVPIPPGSGENYAGLFTVDLPAGVRAGQSFTITVRRIATRRPDAGRDVAAGTTAAAGPAAEKTMLNWRYITGTFAVQIPVTTANTMLPQEETTLAIMRWRLEQMTPPNRWIPVLKRYIGLIEGRIRGLGRNPKSIKPSPWGYEPHGLTGGGAPGHGDDATGKVNGVVYDRFGDFEGFHLLTEDGHERGYRSREAEIEALVRYAWAERVVVTVVSEAHKPDQPVSIILRRAPPQPRRWHA